MLIVHRLSLKVGGKTVLHDLNFTIAPGEALVLFGPNGSGKTSLVKTIMGLAGYRVTRGEIVYKGDVIDGLPTEDRVRRGIGVMYQHPPAIRGVPLREVARFLSHDERRIEDLAEELSLTGLLDRDLNLAYSGGEMKRSELFQMLLQDPDLVLLDEPESGVDLENISRMGAALNRFLKREGKAALIITHTGYILDYVEAERGGVLLNGRFWCLKDPKKIFQDIRREGYEKCVVCHERESSGAP